MKLLRIALAALLLASPAWAGMTVPYVTGPKFQGVRITSTQSVTVGAVTKVQLNSISTFGTVNYWDATNFWYLPLVSGTYRVCAAGYLGATSQTGVEVNVSKNGTSGSGGIEIMNMDVNAAFTSNTGLSPGCTLTAMNGSTDKLELDITVAGASGGVIQFVRASTQMIVEWVSP
jgi:uncharacterized 2Fe-2S/4Fe-4S cluster protein (DUF4445 family)